MTKGLPVIWCDFNARGWSGEKKDDCYYVFEAHRFAAIQPTVGMRVILYMNDDEETSIACEGVLEHWQDRWRARPDESTWEELTNIEIEILKAAKENPT